MAKIILIQVKKKPNLENNVKSDKKKAWDTIIDRVSGKLADKSLENGQNTEKV